MLVFTFLLVAVRFSSSTGIYQSSYSTLSLIGVAARWPEGSCEAAAQVAYRSLEASLDGGALERHLGGAAEVAV